MPGFFPRREAVQEQSNPLASHREQFCASLRLPLHLILAFLHLCRDEEYRGDDKDRAKIRVGQRDGARVARGRRRAGKWRVRRVMAKEQSLSADRGLRRRRGKTAMAAKGGVAFALPRGWTDGSGAGREECTSQCGHCDTYSRQAWELRILGRSSTSSSSMLSTLSMKKRIVVEGGRGSGVEAASIGSSEKARIAKRG